MLIQRIVLALRYSFNDNTDDDRKSFEPNDYNNNYDNNYDNDCYQ